MRPLSQPCIMYSCVILCGYVHVCVCTCVCVCVYMCVWVCVCMCVCVCVHVCVRVCVCMCVCVWSTLTQLTRQLHMHVFQNRVQGSVSSASVPAKWLQVSFDKLNSVTNGVNVQYS